MVRWRMDGLTVYAFRGLTFGEHVKANSAKTHPLQYKYGWKVGHPQNIYLHAEVSCLVANRFDNPHAIYVVRIGGTGDKEWRFSKPCATCEAALRDERIRHAYYSVNCYPGRSEQTHNCWELS